MDIIEIREKYDNGDYTYKADIPKKVWDDHIFDEELSVKRNRELAIEHNQKVNELRIEARNKQLELDQQFTADIVGYIQEEYGFNEFQAREIEHFVYEEHHSCMYDYFIYIDTFADWAYKLRSLEG